MQAQMDSMCKMVQTDYCLKSEPPCVKHMWLVHTSESEDQITTIS